MANILMQQRYVPQGDPPISVEPKDLLTEYKCFECLSETELLAVIVIALNQYMQAYDLPTELPDLLQDSACYNCLSDKQLLQVIVSALSQLAYGDTYVTIDDVRSQIKCLLCADAKRIRAIIAAMLVGLANTLYPEA